MIRLVIGREAQNEHETKIDLRAIDLHVESRGIQAIYFCEQFPRVFADCKSWLVETHNKNYGNLNIHGIGLEVVPEAPIPC
jgi:hypothetical protein